MEPGIPLSPDDPIPLDDILVQDLFAKIGHDFPDRLFARVINESGEKQQPTLENITWGRLLRDALDAARLLVSYGVPRRNSSDVPQTVIAILAASTYRYYTYFVAVWLNGWTPMLLSTRNSLPAIHHLVSSVNARAILLDDTTNDMEQDLGRLAPDLVIMKMGLPGGHVSELPNTPSQAKVIDLDEVAIYLHTSGSQGHPKPIATTHREFVGGIKIRSAKRFKGSPGYIPAPLFHGMGLYSATRWPIGAGVPPTLLETKRPLNGDTVLDHLRLLPGALVFIPPSILDGIVDAGQVDQLVQCGVVHIIYSGASLKDSTGDTLVSKGISLGSAYGMTEVPGVTSMDDLCGDPRDWSYVRFIKDKYTYHFLPVDSTSAARELVIGPGELHPAVLNHELGFATRDLWAPHPTKKGLWKHMGRKDGVTVLSTGEKTDNRQLVSLLTRDPRIALAVVFGSGRPLNGVIISPYQTDLPSTGKFDPNAFRESIWNTISKVNNTIPQHSRLIKPMVIVESPSKPFVKTDKGTVRTPDTLALYEAEIAAAYSAFEAGTHVTENMEDMRTTDPSQVTKMVRDIVEKVCERSLDDETDIFNAGADSIHALQIRSALVSLIKILDPEFVVPHNLVYTYPTIKQLVTLSLDCMRGTRSVPLLKDTRQTRIEDCIRRLSDGLPILDAQPNSREVAVLLTGSTGRLGCHLLDHLLTLPNVTGVYCLVRGEASIHSLEDAFRSRGLSTVRLAENRDKIQVYRADFSKPDLALDVESLRLLRQEVTHVFHLAWHLNFNWPLERFEKFHIAGVRHLIDLVRSSTRSSPPKLVFASSVGSVGNYTLSEHIPEQAIYDASVSLENGYGEGKYVAERLIDTVARKLGFPATIIRCGQLSGSVVDGAWARTEFIPVLFKSSLALGLFPETMPPVRWLPVEVVARCFTELALNVTPGVTYYHIENNESTPWAEITRMFIASTHRSVKVVPTTGWLAAVEEVGRKSDKSSITSAPAAVLLEFFSGLTEERDAKSTLDICVSSQIAPEMRYGRMTPGLMDKYVRWVADN